MIRNFLINYKIFTNVCFSKKLNRHSSILLTMKLLSHSEQPSLESLHTKGRMPEDRSSSLCGCRIKLREKKDKQDETHAQ